MAKQTKKVEDDGAEGVRFYRVLHEAGAYIDDIYYAKDDIVPLSTESYVDRKGNTIEFKVPQWGVEVDENGNDIDDADVRHANLSERALKQADNLSKRIAGVATNPQRTNVPEPKDNPVESSSPSLLNDAQKEQVKESLALLEADNDAHWTSRGLPNTETVSSVVGFAVERKDIEAVDNTFTREKLKKQLAAPKRAPDAV